MVFFRILKKENVSIKLVITMNFIANKYQANEVLKFIRQNANLTQEELAKRINKSKNWVKNNEQGINRYFFEDLIKIADLCNIDIIIQKRKEK